MDGGRYAMGVTTGEKIQRLRAGGSYAAVGRAVGCSASYIRKMESQNCMPGLGLGLRLAEFFDVPAAWLADDSAEWPPPATDRGRVAELVSGALESAGLGGRLSVDELACLVKWRQLTVAQQSRVGGYIEGLMAGADPMEAVKRGIADVPGARRGAKGRGA